MQQLVIKNGRVVATHRIDQDLTGLYPEATIKIAEDDYKMVSIVGPADPLARLTKLQEFQSQGLHEFIPVDYRLVKNSTMPTLTLDQEATIKLAELDRAAAAAYVAGFASSATGEELWYDSDKDTRAVIGDLYTDALNGTFDDTVYFTGLAPGLAPVRARPSQLSPESSKVIYYFTSAQIKVLRADMRIAWAAVKARIWAKQGEVKAAYDAGSIEGVRAVVW